MQQATAGATEDRLVLAWVRRVQPGPLPELGLADLMDPRRVIMMGRPPTRIDLLKSIDGVRFATAWKNRMRVKFGGLNVNVISRRDLIRNKRAAGRPSDQLDVAALTRAK